MIYKKKAFNLCDEIWECLNIIIDIEVINKSPFPLYPFRTSDEDKPIMDSQMQILVSLGMLFKNSTSHKTPVRLITCKITKDMHAVVDCRLLNTYIMCRYTATLLLRDILSTLCNSTCEILSHVDVKDVFKSIKLSVQAKEYCGILPYFGSLLQRYKVPAIDLTTSPAKWIECVHLHLENITRRTY